MLCDMSICDMSICQYVNVNVTTILKKCVSHKFMGAAMTLDMLKRSSPIVVKPRNVLAAGLVDLRYDR